MEAKGVHPALPFSDGIETFVVSGATTWPLPAATPTTASLQLVRSLLVSLESTRARGATAALVLALPLCL